MADEEDLEEIKKKKMQDIKEKQGSPEAQEEAKEKMEAQKKAMLRKVMTTDARERLGRVRMARPQLAEKIESQIISLAQRGATKGKIDDETLKELLKKVSGQKKDINIKRR
ncbi:MAG: DNA-binding protein [Candidatus Thermoplasmatota archaeon]|nr:DNA-binding protein [Candidatus Thermoplasmatota archaeon]